MTVGGPYFFFIKMELYRDNRKQKHEEQKFRDFSQSKKKTAKLLPRFEPQKNQQKTQLFEPLKSRFSTAQKYKDLKKFQTFLEDQRPPAHYRKDLKRLDPNKSRFSSSSSPSLF